MCGFFPHGVRRPTRTYSPVCRWANVSAVESTTAAQEEGANANPMREWGFDTPPIVEDVGFAGGVERELRRLPFPRQPRYPVLHAREQR